MESWMMGILYGDGRKTRRFVLGQGQASSLYMHYGLALHMGLDVEKLVYTYYLLPTVLKAQSHLADAPPHGTTPTYRPIHVWES
jgi:hypothetical protein